MTAAAACLLIDPTRPSGKRVTGGFKTDGSRGRYDCYGAASSGGHCR